MRAELSREEKLNVLTHGVMAAAFIIWMCIGVPQTWAAQGTVAGVGILIFFLCMICMFTASALYHAMPAGSAAKDVLHIFDHICIYLAIAGSYTPVCMLTLWEGIGKVLLALVWGIAAAGMILKLFWVYCPKWVSSVLYIGMGWVCILAFPQLWNNLSAAQFGWLLAGGIIYTIGGVIYALKLSIFNDRHPCFGSHEIFHLFVMGGSLCHFIVMFLLV